MLFGCNIAQTVLYLNWQMIGMFSQRNDRYDRYVFTKKSSVCFLEEIGES